KMFTSVLLLCMVISRVMSQGWGKPEVGTCPDIPVMEDFDISKVYGRWYDVAHNHWLFGEPSICCVTADYSEIDGADMASVQSEELRVLGSSTHLQVNGVAQHTDNPGQFEFYVPEVENPPSDGTSNYNFIATDYENYACVYECMQVEPELMEVLAFALSRDNQGENLCKDAFEAIGVVVDELVYTVHDDDCTYGL
ncbi:unnamed protein product, partial [Meganyctiphanes norvegica]